MGAIMANDSRNSLSFGIKDDVIRVVAVGEIRAADTFALNECLLPYIEKVRDMKRIYIDLAGCDYMDSTFIGFITALAVKCRKNACDIVRIVDPSERALGALRKLSALKEIAIVRGVPLGHVPVFEVAPEMGSFSGRKNIEILFEAHAALSGLSAENRREFEDLLSELKRVLVSK